MKTFLKLAAPATALCALTAGIVGCSFSTMEQCQAMSSGRGGDCFRDPFLPANDAYAYAPKAVTKPAHHAKAR